MLVGRNYVNKHNISNYFKQKKKKQNRYLYFNKSPQTCHLK
jgi:hypothetical protein